MRWLLFLLVAVLLAADCDEDEVPTDNDNITHHFPLEVEPVLSPDGAYVYYVSIDTLQPGRSSLFRALVAMPVRENLEKPGTLAKDTTHSPTVSSSFEAVAFLDENLLYECPIAGTECTGVQVGSFYGVAYLGDSVLAMAARDSIYLAGVDRTSRTFLMRGWEPRAVNDSSIACVIGGNSQWRIVQANRDGVFDTLLTYSGERPRWPDYDDGLNRLAYTVQSADSFLVLVADLNVMTLDTIAAARYPKVCFASQTLLLLTGANGLLYSVNPGGGMPQPWVHVEEE